MSETTFRRWISVGEAEGIHAVMIARYGGADGLRDPSGLASALGRARNGYYPDVIAEAACLLESLAINHPFVDGNKRVAFAVADCFLRLNGWGLCGDSRILHADWMALFSAGQVDFVHLDRWLRGLAMPVNRKDQHADAALEQTETDPGVPGNISSGVAPP